MCLPVCMYRRDTERVYERRQGVCAGGYSWREMHTDREVHTDRHPQQIILSSPSPTHPNNATHHHMHCTRTPSTIPSPPPPSPPTAPTTQHNTTRQFTGIGGVIHIRLKRGDAPPPATDPPPDPNASSASSSSASSNPSSTTPPIPPEAAPLPPPLPTHNLVWLRLEVEDDGIGIPRELQTQIFSCFFSGAHQPGAEKGHGLGLAITKELVDLMRGRISVQSEVGRGSVFTVLLPVTVVDAAGGIKEGGDATALSARASPSPPLPNGETPAPEQQPQQHTQTTQRTSPLAAFTTLADRLSGGGGNGGWGSKGAAAAGRWTSRGAAAGGTSAPSSSSSSSTALPPSATPTLPRPPPTATAPAAALAGGTGGEGEGRRLRGVRVLAVEDMLPNQMGAC